MPQRNRHFHPSHHPLQDHSSLRLEQHRVNGPFSSLNPTTAHFRPTSHLSKHIEPCHEQSDEENPNPPQPPQEKEDKESDTVPASSVSYKWTSRNNRKGRHALAINPCTTPEETKYLAPKPTNSLQAIARGILRMFTRFPIWDISYDVATIFTFGSVVWIINAFFVFLPLVRPDTEFNNEILYGGGITAFIGATIFEVGSFMLLAEAVNENRTGCFGWAVEQAISHHSYPEGKNKQVLRLRPQKDACTHHHLNKRNLLGKGSPPSTSTTSSSADANASAKSWTWFPTATDVRTKYLHELGFLASLIQLLAATIFWVSGFTSLPGIYDALSPTLTIVFYWTPQVVGGAGFILSGLLFMIETQGRWYKPAFGTLGWHIGFFNMIGGVGFTLCPCFGYDGASWAQYQASCSTFWGSWAFLIGSAVQWYESLEKFPVEEEKSDVGSIGESGRLK